MFSTRRHHRRHCDPSRTRWALEWSASADRRPLKSPARSSGSTHLFRPRHATFARTQGDQVVATYFPAPHSYTGEHVVEISAHGSPVVLRQIVEQAMQSGARLAEPGEFTLRAFLNGRIDLVQAEAVADLDRRGDAASGARGVRSARGHADRAHRGDRCGVVRSDRAAGGVARLSGRGLSLRRSRRGGRRAAVRSKSKLGALLCDARRGRLDPRGCARRDCRQAQRGQVEPVQCAAPSRAGHRDADSGHNAGISSPKRPISKDCDSSSSTRPACATHVTK